MKKIIFLVILLVAAAGCTREQLPSTSADITAHDLRAHVQFLASDELEGRLTGAKGNTIAARYLADHFARWGLKPIGDDGGYLQSFEFIAGVKLGSANALNFTSPEMNWQLTPDVDFRPLAYASDTTVTGTLVFAGYGISSDSLRYDDFANLDVSGKIVLVFRYTPEGDNPHSGFFPYSAIRRKALMARDKGAVGMVVVTGFADDPNPELMLLRYDRGFGDAGLPIVHLRTQIADSLFSVVGKTISTVQSEINSSKIPQSFEFSSLSVTLAAQVVKVRSSSANVIGIVEGSDPQLKDQAIVFGAHFDHLGFGGENSGSLRPDSVAVHNGADDNASGTAALLELAQAFANSSNRPRHSMIFAAFSGEEMGLLGSAHYVKYPSIPTERTIAMMNMDMVGRLRDSALTIEGLGTSPVWKAMIEEIATRYPFKLRLGEGGFGPSDHSSFYGKDIPNLFFFTGIHEDYHKPSDDWDKINYDGEQSITRFIFDIAQKMDTGERPLFTKVQGGAGQNEGRRGFRVSFGIVPDYSEDPAGFRISGTRDGSPAARAGLKAQDVILKFGGRTVKSIYDLTYLLEEHKPGDQVEVVLKRGDEIVTVQVTLEARR